MSQITVRTIDWADPNDAVIAISLLDDYSHHPMGDHGPLRPTVLARLRDLMLNHAGAFTLIAFAEQGQPIGIAVCLSSLSTFKAALRINIHDFFVCPPRRGTGVGKKLLAAVVHAAQQQGACAVTLEVRADNPAALRLYKRFGFQGIGPPIPREDAQQEPIYYFGTFDIAAVDP